MRLSQARLMTKLLKLTVAQVNETVFDGEVISVTLPGVDGELTIMANHTPLVTPLKAGKIKIKKTDSENVEIDVKTGTLEVSQNHVTLLI